MKAKISKQNKMSAKRIAEFSGSKPIVEINEVSRPLYILVAQNSRFNFIATVLHNSETDELEVRGRIRFEQMGNKVIIGNKEPQPYSYMQYETMKQDIGSMIKNLDMLNPSIVTELSFHKGEDTDSIIHKMHDSNLFDIGQTKNDKK